MNDIFMLTSSHRSGSILISSIGLGSSRIGLTRSPSHRPVPILAISAFALLLRPASLQQSSANDRGCESTSDMAPHDGNVP
jgi:hypothetical protein